MAMQTTARAYPGRDLEAMSFAQNYHRWIVDELSPYLGDCVAEVGAGSGSISRLLLDCGVKRLRAFEPSDNLYPRLAEALRDDCRAIAVKDFFHAARSEAFDSIVYVNVLEHIEEDRAEVARAFDALNRGGHLLLFVPALAWLFSAHDREIGHFRRYTKVGLRNVVVDAGFTIVKARYFDAFGIVPWYVNFVLLRNSLSSKSVDLYDRIAVPVLRAIESAITPPIGKNLLLVARKP